jgi:hypothetical protein
MKHMIKHMMYQYAVMQYVLDAVQRAVEHMYLLR